MEQIDLSKLEDNKQTVQRYTAPSALQLASNIAVLYYTRKERGALWLMKMTL